MVSLFNIPIWISSYVNVISEPNKLCVLCIFSYFLLFGTLLIIAYLLALYYVWLAVSIWYALCGTIIFCWSDGIDLVHIMWDDNIRCRYMCVYIHICHCICVVTIHCNQIGPKPGTAVPWLVFKLSNKVPLITCLNQQ